jgi:hypothetical protein
MRSVKSKLAIICIIFIVSHLAVAGIQPSPFICVIDPYVRLQSAEQWQRALLSGEVQAMTQSQWDEYMAQLRDPDNEHEGRSFGDPDFKPPELYVHAKDVGLAPGLVMAWGEEDLLPNGYASAWMYEYAYDPDLSNCTISITVFAPNDPNITTVSFGIQDINGNIRSWHWDVPATIPHNTLTPITINTAVLGLTATSPVADGYMNNPAFEITQAKFFIVDENCNWVGGPATIPPPGQVDPRPWNYWKDLVVTPNPADPGLAVGINIDIHQDIRDDEVNDFHIEGRIQSGPDGGDWSDPPVLLSHIDGDGNFPNFNCTIEHDSTDPCENWYIFKADWWTDTTIPYCTVLHLGLEFEVSCHNVIIDLVGWWTRDGQRVGTTGVNGGFVPIPGFDVQDDIVGHPPEPCQVMRLQNGNLNGQQDPGEISTEIVALDLAGLSPVELVTVLGPNPFAELRVSGKQEDLQWVAVENEFGPISSTNPQDFPADSFFDVFLDPALDIIHTVDPIVLEGGDFLIARQQLKFTNNSGEEDYRWVFEIHEAHEPESDLGDAPDSSNSFGAAAGMTAYPWGVMANYATVYQAGSPPYGPIHLAPSAVAHLGRAVTREQEADILFDQDPTNNIIPLANRPDRDLADDGVLGIPLKLPDCKQTSFRYVVNVINPNVDLYTNVWFDWERDGDWDDTPTCTDGTSVPEWAVQDQLLAAGTLAIGPNTITTPLFTCWQPTTSCSDPPLWMRMTLSEQPWTGSGAGMVGNDGSGPVGGYQFGETEDYYFIPRTGRNPNPDLNLDGIVNFIEIAIIANWWLAVPPDPCFEP